MEKEKENSTLCFAAIDFCHSGKHAVGAGEFLRQEVEANDCKCSNQRTGTEVNAGILRPEKFDASAPTLQCSVLSKCNVGEKMESTESLVSSGNCLSASSGASLQAVQMKLEVPEDFWDDLDHIVLKERQKMLLSSSQISLMPCLTMRSLFVFLVDLGSDGRAEDCSSWLLVRIQQGNISGLCSKAVNNMICRNTGLEKEDMNSGGQESSVDGNCSYDIPEGNASVFGQTFGFGSSTGMLAGSISMNPSLAPHYQGAKTTKSQNFANIHENDGTCSSQKSDPDHEKCGGDDLLSGNHKAILSSGVSTFALVKDEPLDNIELHSSDTNAVGNSCFANMIPVKSELEIANESFEDKVDHMLLRERMKLLASWDISSSDIYANFEYHRKFVSTGPDCSPIVRESAVPLRTKRLRKRKKTATDSVETALEEDAPGLLQVLIDKGVLLDEIKLYGEPESNEALDDSLSEDSFTELEAVIRKLFSQRQSLLKFAPIRCTKGERATYCLASLISLVEQARYLQFRKWPVEWGWCRDLQSFIFVFERHNRIVLERPEYGYATYFFELVDSVSIDWQIKRLVTAMKLTSYSRVTLIENKALVVGEDLTEGEARVLMEYGWAPNSGLGTMLNYCDRVVHDRKNERDSSEWRAKIGKLLMDGYNGGTVVLTEVPRKVAEFNVAQSPKIKLELS
ncbi:hypothetical protein RJ640_003811 [Escallonia rubra]|uniref:Uncharacterized protein n=1 Tax=Escallonia rubra TaxID=112253 RepID=A0AA88RTK6_9ASTE|nr:hypothetical protein RJ640_003811 [Escallonia rubra]